MTKSNMICPNLLELTKVTKVWPRARMTKILKTYEHNYSTAQKQVTSRIVFPARLDSHGVLCELHIARTIKV